MVMGTGCGYVFCWILGLETCDVLFSLGCGSAALFSALRFCFVG